MKHTGLSMVATLCVLCALVTAARGADPPNAKPAPQCEPSSEPLGIRHRRRRAPRLEGADRRQGGNDDYLGGPRVQDGHRIRDDPHRRGQADLREPSRDRTRAGAIVGRRSPRQEDDLGRGPCVSRPRYVSRDRAEARGGDRRRQPRIRLHAHGRRDGNLPAARPWNPSARSWKWVEFGRPPNT